MKQEVYAMKLAIVDLDGVVCTNGERFAIAEQAIAAALQQQLAAPQQQRGELLLQIKNVLKDIEDVYWRTAFTPALVELDRLIEGVNEAIEQIQAEGFRVIFLTSRPESMRAATAVWLETNLRIEIDGNMLVMKPESQQFVKTQVWKRGAVELLVRFLAGIPPLDELLFVDDEEAHRTAIQELDLPCETRVAASLQECLAAMTEKGKETCL